MSQGEIEETVESAVAPRGRMFFALFGGALAWSIHFLASYAIVAIGCVYRWTGISLIVAVLTVLLAGMALWSTLVAWREWRRQSRDQPWDSVLSEPRGWYPWLMTTGVLLGITSAFTIVLEGFGSLLLPVCGWSTP